MRVERVERSNLKKKVATVSRRSKNLWPGANEVRCGGYRKKPTIARESLCRVGLTLSGRRANIVIGCCIHIMQPTDEFRCICAVLTAGGLRREPPADEPPPAEHPRGGTAPGLEDEVTGPALGAATGLG
jgi:hypothetical protein